MCQINLTIFEIWKTACLLGTASILIVIMYSDFWSLVEMEHWSVQHCISAMELFIKTESVTAIQRGFWQQSETWCFWPQYSAIVGIKWRQEGSVKDSKPQGCPLSARTPDNVEQVRNATLRCPRRSARRQALTLRFKECSICWILHKNLHYRPHKNQVAQELSEREKVSWLQFCNEFLDLVENNIDIVNILLTSVKVHFHMSGYANKQKCRYWAPTQELHQHPLYSAKVTMWCAVSSYGTIGPFCFENVEGHTLNTNKERYKVMLETFLRSELHPCQQQCYGSNKMEQLVHSIISTQVHRTMFLGRLISQSGTSPALPTCLTLQYHATSSGTTLKAGYTKRIPPTLLT